jgi:hypothetical protein
MQEGFMLKKSLIFVSAVLFLAALITLTGCPTSADDGSSSIVYAHRIYGTDVTPYEAQEAIDNAVAAGEPVVLENGLTIAGPGHLNFKNAQVRINGMVRFNGGGIVSVVDASVTWAPDSSFDLPGGAYIHRYGTNVSGVNVDALVEYAESLETIFATAHKAGVRRFKLGPIQNFDYSTSSNGIDARINAVDLEELYVLDELVIDSSATVPGTGLSVTAMGSVDVTGTPPNAVVVGGGTLPLGTCSTLTTSKGGVVVPVPGTPTRIPNIKVDEGKDYSIQQAAVGTLTIEGKLTGAGTLDVLGAVEDITIRGGNGSIRFPGAANPGVIDIASTGKVTFNNLIALTGASTIAGDVVFRGNVTTAAALELYGNVTLVSPGILNLNSLNTLTLGRGKTISVEFTPRNASTVIAPVLSAGPEDVVLTPDTAAVTLTVPADPTQNSDAAISAAKRLTLAGQDLTITRGILQVAPGAAFAINAVSVTTNITDTQIGYLAAADGGAIVLVGAGDIDIGDTVIATASTLRAGGGTVTLGNNKIAGSVTGAVLTAATGAPSFTLDGTTGLLSLEQTDLNLAANGSVVINDAEGRVILTGQAKIILNNGEGGVPTARSRITNGGNVGILSGGVVGLTAPTATTTQAVWSVAHRDAAAADVSIVAAAAGFTLSKTGTSFTN